jgi:hypothetical protein
MLQSIGKMRTKQDQKYGPLPFGHFECNEFERSECRLNEEA